MRVLNQFSAHHSSLIGVGRPKLSITSTLVSHAAIRTRPRNHPVASSSRSDLKAGDFQSGLDKPLLILVLGGSGFVGSAFIAAARRRGHKIVSLSRRGRLPGEKDDDGVKWITGDATSPSVIQRAVDSNPGINAAFHSIGLLLDSQSGLASLNKMASGSGSEPSPDASYDSITRVTALSAIDAMRNQSKRLRDETRDGRSAAIPFVFVSAAEAGWSFKVRGTEDLFVIDSLTLIPHQAPVDFLERYLVAKRAVENELLDENKRDLIRGTVLRPSLIWTWSRPQALPSVIPFYLANAMGLSFVDRPVLLETLVEAALLSIEGEGKGVLDYHEMERLAAAGKRAS